MLPEIAGCDDGQRCRIDVAPMITHRYASLDALPSAFVDARQESNYVKGVLTLD